MKIISRNNIILTISFLINFTIASAQSNKNPYQKVKFTDGVYFNPQAFMSQQPSLAKSQLLIGNIMVNSIRSWSKSDSLFYKDVEGHKNAMVREKIWGIYENGDLYIFHNGKTNKVNTIGMLSLFNETFVLVKAPNAPVALDQTKDVRPYLTDLSTGMIYEYSIESFKQLMQLKDEQIYNQFMTYKSNKKRREMMYHCIELYNDKHPIF